MSRLPRSLRTRLLVANLIVVGAALGTVVVAVSLVGPGYFADAMGHRPGDPTGAAMDAATRVAFNDAIRNALLAAGVIAVVTAIVVSLAVSAAIAGPVTRLVAAARRIARGHYAERVPEEGEGELGELARSFNAMTGSLEATEQRRLQLVGDVAHELRTPLSTLDGYLEGLEDGVVAPTDETWRLLRGETARLTRLVDDLQELWRAEARQLPLRIEEIDAGTVVREVIEQFKPQVIARRIDLESDLAAGLTVRADRDRLAQIVANYLSNAIRYSPDGAPVQVQARRVEDQVEIVVVDRGPGLCQDEILGPSLVQTADRIDGPVAVNRSGPSRRTLLTRFDTEATNSAAGAAGAWRGARRRPRTRDRARSTSARGRGWPASGRGPGRGVRSGSSSRSRRSVAAAPRRPARARPTRARPGRAACRRPG